MRKNVSALLNQSRLRSGDLATSDDDGLNGCFMINRQGLDSLRVIAATGRSLVERGWEHVSVSIWNRCPTWEEMCFVRDLFWDDHETVLQFHPRKSEYINQHPFVLHLWRNRNRNIELPPARLV